MLRAPYVRYVDDFALFADDAAQLQPFRGFELLPDCRRLADLRRDWQQSEIGAPDVHRRVQSWTAHALHADTVRLRHTLFKGGWFDPQWSDGSPVKVPAP